MTRNAGVPPVEDDLGRLHFKWDMAELSVAPFRPKATCRVAMIDNTGEIVYRELSLRTDAAALLARLLRILAREQADQVQAPHARLLRTELCCQIVAVARLDERDDYEWALGVAESLDPAAESSLGTGLSDPLHSGGVQRRFPLAQVREIGSGSDRRVHVSWPDAVFTLMCDPTDDRVSVAFGTPEGEQRFECAKDGVLCLLALQEALTLVDKAVAHTDIELERLFSLQSDLEALRQQVIAGLDARTACLRLIKLCDPYGRPVTSESTPIGQLIATATMAALQWIARRGGPPLERRIDLEAVAAAARRELNPRDDEHVLPFRHGVLVLRDGGDLGLGRAMLPGRARSLLSRQAAFAMYTLDWMPYELSKLDALGHEPLPGTQEAVLRAVAEPWLEV